MSYQNNGGLQRSNFNQSCCSQSHDCLKSITALKEKNKRLSSDFKLMHEKLQLHDQTTQIKFNLLQKELEESKGEVQKRNRLLVSLLKQLKPELNDLSSVEEMLSEVSKRYGCTKLTETCHGVTVQFN